MIAQAWSGGSQHLDQADSNDDGDEGGGDGEYIAQRKERPA